MKYRTMVWLLLGCLLAGPVAGQQISSFKSFKAAKADYENVKVLPVHTDEAVSSFIIFVKKAVAPHYHKDHSEHVVVLEGKGLMQLGDEQRKIRKGDIVVIPKGVVHSVRVTSRKPMKVLSVQAPEFKGKDRIFVEKN